MMIKDNRNLEADTYGWTKALKTPDRNCSSINHVQLYTYT